TVKEKTGAVTRYCLTAFTGTPSISTRILVRESTTDLAIACNCSTVKSVGGKTQRLLSASDTKIDANNAFPAGTVKWRSTTGTTFPRKQRCSGCPMEKWS